MPRPLISEALRGHGAVLRDSAGDQFVDELLPRDIVSRKIALKLAEQATDHVWLDATGLEDFERRFPTIASALAEAGLDPATDWLPVAPAAHYLSGGLLVDLDGATALPGLWAAGEVACSGVHGANRLASNSLLEGMVFGTRCVDAIVSGRDGPEETGALAGLAESPSGPSPSAEAPVPIPVRQVVDCRCGSQHPGDPSWRVGTSPGDDTRAEAQRKALQAAMTIWAGVLRDASSLAKASDAVAAVVAEIGPGVDRATAELRNLTDVARAVLEAATQREETRGCHARSDFPETSSALRCRLSHGSRDGGVPRAAEPRAASVPAE
jgi:L-aspartate oxidase